MWATPDAKFAQAQCRVYNTWVWEMFRAYNDSLFGFEVPEHQRLEAYV